MDDHPRTRLGTISIWLSLIPYAALIAFLIINPPCSSPLSQLKDVIIAGPIVSLLFSILAVIRDRPKKRAVIGLSISSLALIALLVLFAFIVAAIATQGTGPPGTIDVFYSRPSGTVDREPGVYIATETKYYDVSGSTEQELRAQMDSLGPNGFAAEANYFFQWNYQFREHDGVCGFERIRVDTLITFTYPRWKESGSHQDLLAGWNRNLANLEKHEKGHEEIYRKASQDIYDSLQTLLPGYESCRELDRAANALAQAVVEEAKKKDIEYDRITDHGRAEPAKNLQQTRADDFKKVRGSE